MAIVINVPKDTRFGDIGRGAGELVGALVQKRRDDKDAKIVSDVRAGTVTESEGLASISPKNRNQVLSAGTSFRAEFPSQTLLELDKSGIAQSSRLGRFPKPGETPLPVAQFNRARVGKSTEAASAIAEVRSTQVDISPVFTDVKDAGRNRAARNIVNQGKDLAGFNRNLYDKLGDLTGDNRVRVDRRTIHYTDYLRGENGRELTLDKNKAFTLAKQEAEKDLRGFLDAQTSNALLTPEEHFGRPQVVPESPDDIPPVVAPKPEAGAVDQFKSFASDLVSKGTRLFDEQEPVQTTSDVSIVEPEVRVQESTEAAQQANYPIQPNEQWIDVGQVHPPVPQSMMDVVKAGGVGAMSPIYASMANVPVHVAEQLLLQNMVKGPMNVLTETLVIPDPVVAPPPISQTTPQELAAQAPPAQNQAVQQPPGVPRNRRFQNPSDAVPAENTFITTP